MSLLAKLDKYLNRTDARRCWIREQVELYMRSLKVLSLFMHRKWTGRCKCQTETMYSRKVSLEGKRSCYMVQEYKEKSLTELHCLPPSLLLSFFSSSLLAFSSFLLFPYPFFLLLHPSCLTFLFVFGIQSSFNSTYFAITTMSILHMW